MTGLLLATTMAVSMSEPIEMVHVEDDEEHEGLIIIEVSEEKLEGEYHDSTGHIHFSSVVTDDGYMLTVMTTEGETVVISRKPRKSSMMTMTMGHTEFMVRTNQPGRGLPKYSDYVVPGAFHNQMESALKRGRLSNKLMRHLGSRNVNETRRKAVEDLASCPEADLIIEAAKALGNAGVMGSDSPAARQFYVLAMDLMKIKDSMQQGEAEASSYHGYPHSFTQGLYSEYGQKQQTCSKCTSGSCPYYGDRSNNCFGMCGNKCSCWWWVCDDCCVHQGCVIHDQCCKDHGYWSWECLSLFDFSCSNYSC